MTDLNEQELLDLENLIDKRGISSILMALSTICGLKADHIKSSYQDSHLARRWQNLEGAIGCQVIHANGL
jgi:hypothetical protein